MSLGDLRGQSLCVEAFHTPERGRVEALTDVVIDLDAAGEIAALHLPGTPAHAEARASERLRSPPPGTVLLPGLVDLHVHAPQYPQLGTALDLPLEDWLDTYTFPLEARYADTAFARRVYEALIDRLLAWGTTTAVYFATLHDAATKVLADVCLEKGQRAFVGRVAMDHPETCPDYYRDPSAEAAVEGTREVIGHIRGHPGNADARVRPMIAPRFVPACTDGLLAGLGALAAETATPVTSHVSEGDWEHAFVLERFGRSDAETLAGFGLMRPGSVMAHGCYLSPSDMATMIRCGTGVAHCPASNAYFGGAAFPLRRALDAGLGVGLGTDIAGGPSASLWDTARLSIQTSRLLESGIDPDLAPEARSTHRPARIDAATAFWLATAGGADVLGLPVGRFAPGQSFDALFIDTTAPGGGLTFWEEGAHDPPERRLERLLYGTGEANIASVYVAGTPVAGRAPAP
ncbi:MAG: amidohydrolase family protein [Paracoccaceae bacterium]|nr:amidohydrolase family protein [Paracoccaceae bacterium]